MARKKWSRPAYRIDWVERWELPFARRVMGGEGARQNISSRTRIVAYETSSDMRRGRTGKKRRSGSTDENREKGNRKETKNIKMSLPKG